ncbi:MAG: peptide chain release factor N(5)-glutamine methyltransferase [Pseudomonadota bacterium]
MPERSETLGEAVRRATRLLRQAGIGEADTDARRCCEAVTGYTPSTLFLHETQSLTPQQSAKLDAMVASRIEGTPVGRILNEREFYGLPFRLVPETLEPRIDTEVLVDTVLDVLPTKPASPPIILDLGCGSGAVGLAILSHRSDVMCVAVDISPNAAACAKANAEMLGVGERFFVVAGSWGAALAVRFDAVISNPPYIPNGDLECLPIEVREHDPILALDGGADGLDAYRSIIADGDRLLAPRGFDATQARDPYQPSPSAGARYRNLPALPDF